MLAYLTSGLIAAAGFGTTAFAGGSVNECGSKHKAAAKYQACGGSPHIHISTPSGCAMGTVKNDDPWRTTTDPETTVRSSGCRAVTLECVDSAAHTAHIGCEDSDSSTESWVNADYLDCVPGNVSTYAAQMPTAYGSGDCGGGPSSGSTLPMKLGDVFATGSVPSALQRCVVENAKTKYNDIQQKVQGEDQLKLFEIAKKMSDADFKTALLRSFTRLHARAARAVNLFGPACDQTPKLPPDAKILSTDIEQGQISCKLAVRADQLLKLMNVDSLSPLETRARWAADAGQVGTSQNMVGLDDKAYRTILFEGLSDSAQDALFNKLNMTRVAGEFERLEQATGPWSGVSFRELHNAYTFGGARMGANKNGMDCSDFISSLYGIKAQEVDPVTGKTSSRVPSTKQLQQIARAVASNGKEPAPGVWNSYVSCFQSVNLKSGARPQPGDIIVQRQHGEGHAVLVESYDATKDPDNVNTLEAFGGSAGTVGPNKRPLFEPRCSNSNFTDPPAVRSDIDVLRFVGGPECPAHPHEACQSQNQTASN